MRLPIALILRLKLKRLTEHPHDRRIAAHEAIRNSISLNILVPKLPALLAAHERAHDVAVAQVHARVAALDSDFVHDACRRRAVR